MHSSIQLIVGLANPGKEYENTRHNAGAWFIDQIANEHHINLRMEPKYHGLYSTTRIDAHPCHLLVPATFMNRSGQAVHACMNYHKIDPASVLIAHDDIDLPVGVIKIKLGGGDGGHNGLKDIIRHLHTKQFYRLRIGVGRPPHPQDVSDYVLSPPSKTEKKLIENVFIDARQALPLLLAGEPQKAMQALHSITK